MELFTQLEEIMFEISFKFQRGQLGINSTVNSNFVKTTDIVNATQVASKYEHCAVLLGNGSVLTFGRNDVFYFCLMYSMGNWELAQ
jgi:alpha-tubulin suppressor-like RCC1 family protein